MLYASHAFFIYLPLTGAVFVQPDQSVDIHFEFSRLERQEIFSFLLDTVRISPHLLLLVKDDLVHGSHSEKKPLGPAVPFAHVMHVAVSSMSQSRKFRTGMGRISH